MLCRKENKASKANRKQGTYPTCNANAAPASLILVAHLLLLYNLGTS